MRTLNKIKISLLTGLLILLASSLVVTVTPNNIRAVTGSDWKAGNIIDDGIFYDNTSMSESDIQAFMNSKVPTCDTNGNQPATEYGRSDLTHAQYAAQKGWAGPPYVCLRDYYQVPNGNQVINNLNTNVIPAGAISAAQIIKNAADAYGISPKALIVTLQKESPGPLLTDNWPLASQYRNAMGYGCPDTAPCDAKYEGFYSQVMNAAWQFKYYKDNPGNFRYKPSQDNNILYSPNQSCGSSVVSIQNLATAGLYNYTPYQPNVAALNNLYGTGDGCSSYGNRNFWRLYNDWFNPYGTIRSGLSMNIVSQPDTSPARGQDVSYTVSFMNNLPYDVTLDAVGIVGRAGDIYNGANRDFGWQGPVTLKPGVAQQFTFTSTIQDTGMIYAWPAVNYKGSYIHYNNWGVAMNAHQANLSVTSPLSMSPSNPVVGQPVTLSASVKNNEAHPIHVDSIGIPIRYYGQYNYDVAWTTPPGGTIAPGASQNLSESTIFDKPGPYTAWVSWNLNGQYTTLSPVIAYNTPSLKPSFTMTYIETPDPTPATGEDVAVKFKLKNNLSLPVTLDAVGVVGRYDNPYTSANRDFGWVGPETFAANEEKSYTSFISTVSQLNNFYAWVAIKYNGTYIHYNNWGFMMSPHAPNLSIVSPIGIAPSNPAPGQTVAVTSSIKNNEPHPIHYDALGIPIRYYGVYNYDATWVGPGVFATAGQVGDTIPLDGKVKLDKPGPYTLWVSANIKGSYLSIGTTKQISL